jgi:phosphatidylserine decarboxylase
LKDKGANPPEGNNITSPASGKIIEIVKISDKDKIKIRKGLLGLIESTTKDIIKEGYLISIFLRLYDNHINRSPLDAKVLSVKHSKGKFKRASSLRALQNEKTEIVLDTVIGKLKLIQMAGYIARRIETFITPGQIIKKGQPLGLIKLGSQVTIILPSNVRIKVKKKQKVKAGSTIIGEF